MTHLTNPGLAALEFLIGTWEMTISRASFLPDPDQTVTGLVNVQPIENATLLALRQLVDPGGPPAATWVIGRDGAKPDYTVLYADARGVSRVYTMSLTGERWRIWRDDPEFSQRFEATIDPDRRHISGSWQKRASKGDWEHDFTVDYARCDR